MSYADNITKCPSEVANSGFWIHFVSTRKDEDIRHPEPCSVPT